MSVLRTCQLVPLESTAVEIFRTTPTDTVCPNFYVLAHANGCAFKPLCSYCYLKTTFDDIENPKVFANIEKLESEVRAWIHEPEHESYVLNSGNLSDSLSLEVARPLMGRLVEIFRHESEKAGKPHSLLLVTKGGVLECASLFERPACSKVIVSFSVNSPEAAERLERGAAKPSDRLEAAHRLKELGWRVRIRIDPMVLGFDYTDTIAAVAALKPERVTLGTLRAEQSLQTYMKNDPYFAALEPLNDSKRLARYPEHIRLKLCQPAVDALKSLCPVALCEETPAFWKVLGLDPTGCRCNCGG